MIPLLQKVVAHGGLNLLLRAITLALRFGLSFYVVRFLGLSAAGIYGLALGAIGIAPAAIGWGLNYFVSREVVGRTPDQAARVVKTRLFVTLCSLSAGTLIAILVTFAMGVHPAPIWILVVVLIWLETLALDLYMPLISLELATQANLVIFTRSAAWVPIIVGMGILWPEARTLELLFGGWIVCHVASLALMAWFLRHWPVAERLRDPVDRNWIKQKLRRSWYIYLSDIGIVGLVFLDRYVVSWQLGLAATGIYTFYWSIANALQTLMQTSVVQLALPKMLKAYTDPDLGRWRRLFRAELIKTIIIALVLALGMWTVVQMIFHLDRSGRFPREQGLLLLLLTASIMRAGSDFLNICITSTGRDRYYAASNIGGVILALTLAFLFISRYGLIGSGIGSAVTAFLLLASRLGYIIHVLRLESHARQPVGPGPAKAG